MYARRGGPDGEVLVIQHRRLQTWLPIGGELEAAVRELREETGLTGRFAVLVGAADGEPPGFLGYEEHHAGSKGLHMNFVFVADVGEDAQVVPNNEFGEFRWVGDVALAQLESPLNVREFGFRALAARAK